MTIFYIFIYSSQPPDGYAGDPPNYQYCTTCHSGAPLNPSNGSVYISNLPPFYQTSTSYYLNIVVKGVGNKRFGFEMIIKDTLNNVMGTFEALNSNTTVSPNGYVKHLNAPYSTDSFVFQVKWTTPNNYQGRAIIYLVGNVANGNGLSSGDSIYARVDTIYHSLSYKEVANVKVYKVKNNVIIETSIKMPINIEFYDKNGTKEFIYNGYLEGKKVFKIKKRGILKIKSYNFSRVIKI
ncbi:MAG: choice-of-anchor V domain-containing protein [candidate division WOR-3 bacterium]|jgi:hypothetical protein